MHRVWREYFNILFASLHDRNFIEILFNILFNISYRDRKISVCILKSRKYARFFFIILFRRFFHVAIEI